MALKERTARNDAENTVALSVPGPSESYGGVTSATAVRNDAVRELARDMTARKVRSGNGEITLSDDEIDAVIDQVAAETSISRAVKAALRKEIRDEIFGYGPIEDLIRDETVTEIMVNAPDQVFVERRGRLEPTAVSFDNEDHVRRIIDRIVSPLGRHIDESSPMVDARLPDGSRVNAVIPPVALRGATLTIRKFGKKPLVMEKLIQYGTLSEDMASFLESAVKGRMNIIISGGTGSGKTTLLNVLSSFIPEEERIITIEDAAELRLMQRHVVPMEARPAGIDGTGEISIRDMVRNSLRMRPDRIVVGEVRGAEALDMLQAMNTGHDGSLTTAHANSPRDTLARIETMALMSGMDLPVMAVRQQCASAFNLIVQQSRFRDGSRKVTNISEISGMVGDTITLQDIFRYEPPSSKDKNSVGSHVACGIRPFCCDKMELNGARISNDWFKKP